MAESTRKMETPVFPIKNRSVHVKWCAVCNDWDRPFTAIWNKIPQSEGFYFFFMSFQWYSTVHGLLFSALFYVWRLTFITLKYKSSGFESKIFHPRSTLTVQGSLYPLLICRKRTKWLQPCCTNAYPSPGHVPSPPHTHTHTHTQGHQCLTEPVLWIIVNSIYNFAEVLVDIF